jgi:hypothetical protein
VRAFYNFSLKGVSSSDLLERLSNKSEPLYVLTDVMPPSPPKILNVTCDLPERELLDIISLFILLLLGHRPYGIHKKGYNPPG